MNNQEIKKNQEIGFFKSMSGYDNLAPSVIPFYEEMQCNVIANIGFTPESKGSLLDLGCGTGKTLEAILKTFPHITVIGIDSSQAMLSDARERLIPFVQSRWKLLDADIIDGSCYPKNVRAVVSIAALNNIMCQHLLPVYKKIYSALVPGGWFVHADFVKHESPEINHHLEILYRSYVEERNTDKEFVKRWFQDSETNFFPITLSEHFSNFSQAGFVDFEIRWLRGNQAVFRARK